MTEEPQMDPAVLDQIRQQVANVELPDVSAQLGKADLDEMFSEMEQEKRDLRVKAAQYRKMYEQRSDQLRVSILARQSLQEQLDQAQAELASLREQIAGGKSDPPATPPDAAPDAGAPRPEQEPTARPEVRDAPVAPPTPPARRRK